MKSLVQVEQIASFFIRYSFEKFKAIQLLPKTAIILRQIYCINIFV